MNILVTGANGQLGKEMRIIAKGSSDHYLFTDINQAEGVATTYLDITDYESIKRIVAKEKIHVIVNCAAWTNVDACEIDEKSATLAEKLNAVAPENLARAMKEVNGLLVQISTDYVFGKEPYNIPCKEEQKGTPTGVYGKTKKLGEQNIINVMGKYVIIRTAWLYSEFGRNFCKTMLELTEKKPTLKVVFDQCGTPTYALNLAKTIEVIIMDYKKNHLSPTYLETGIYHFSNEGVCSWFDFAQMIAEYSGHTRCEIVPCYSSDYPSPVKRPAYSVLDKSKIKKTFGVKVPYWTVSLKKCISNIEKRSK